MILFLICPGKSLLALKRGIILLLRMLPIFLCVVLFSSFIAIFLSPKTIQKYMGQQSGLKGVIIAALLGTIIVGPLWVLFPLFGTLLKKGARISVVGAMIGTFAIKTPWIPYAASFLGWPFIIITVILTLIYAILEGLLMEKILNGENSN
ncbi:MAG: hypothetical protein DRQ10_02875 [Candidatus Hydrothermota bacterium]|nr:MAG: hypothetical protein DRQ10_02875 [Candidatus Hydrothermae bacterium]